MQEEPQTPPSTLISNMHNTHFSTCSTPYASAPSSPGGHFYYYSAPTSPMHYLSSTPSLASCSSSAFENFDDFNDNFDFSAKLTGNGGGTCSRPMSSADELFCNGKIRPMKLSSHLQLPQMLEPLIDEDEEDNEVLDDDEKIGISRIKFRNNSLHRRTRSTPLRSNEFGVDDVVIVANNIEEIGNVDVGKEGGKIEERITTKKITKKSVGRSSKRWTLLKEFLYRSKSEGSNNNNGHKFWNNLSFSHVHKDKKVGKMEKSREKLKIPKMKKKGENGVMGKRRMAPMQSTHEMHYISKRAQDEEMKRKTFLPYSQGLLGCLGFSSRSYGAWNGFTRSLNPVSSM
ncbi:hypothetical protein Leryth_001400 [Lithospermum erythrorhizon]|uniref:Uncharacterized protein n=1 Tax=Lithospermum erythrorhizon TaxID=34254 RepID=A0AAV3NRA4_LITER|nr:hypothetical protein Leryth_001400 [Lithospermum erythrorhizon]